MWTDGDILFLTSYSISCFLTQARMFGAPTKHIKQSDLAICTTPLNTYIYALTAKNTLMGMGVVWALMIATKLSTNQQHRLFFSSYITVMFVIPKRIIYIVYICICLLLFRGNIFLWYNGEWRWERVDLGKAINEFKARSLRAYCWVGGCLTQHLFTLFVCGAALNLCLSVELFNVWV